MTSVLAHMRLETQYEVKTTPSAPGEHIDGFMSSQELWWLYRTAAKMSSIIEIGSWQGRSTYALCKGCPGTVYAVDHFRGSKEHQDYIKAGLRPFEAFQKNMKEFTNLVVVPKSSAEAWNDPLIPQQVDMVFIDGSHTYIDFMDDLLLWGPRATKLLCGHDRSYSEIIQALAELNLPWQRCADSIWCTIDRSNYAPLS